MGHFHRRCAYGAWRTSFLITEYFRQRPTVLTPIWSAHTSSPTAHTGTFAPNKRDVDQYCPPTPVTYNTNTSQTPACDVKLHKTSRPVSTSSSISLITNITQRSIRGFILVYTMEQIDSGAWYDRLGPRVAGAGVNTWVHFGLHYRADRFWCLV